jgi:hypothetical protein
MLFLVVGLSTAAITCTTIDNAPRGASVELKNLARLDAQFTSGIDAILRDPGIFTRDEVDICGEKLQRDMFTRVLRRVSRTTNAQITVRVQRSTQDESIRPEFITDLRVLRTAVQMKVDEGFVKGAAPSDLNLTFSRDFAVQSVGAPRQTITIGQ